jgi:hypothetical protein
MSNKNNINDFLNVTSTDYKPSISNIKIINKNNIQKGGNYSPTSSFNQLGGVNNKDINNLISMLTSDSQMDNILDSNTNTSQLENKLKNLLNQEGGNKNNYSDMYNSNFIKQNNQKGGAANLVALGAAAALAYGLTSESDFVSNLFGKSKNDNKNVDITTTDMGSVTSSAVPTNNNFSATSDSDNVFQKPSTKKSNQLGGNSSVTSSIMPGNNYNLSSTSDNFKQRGGSYSITSSAMPNNNNLSTTSEFENVFQKPNNINPIQRGGSYSVTSSAMPMNNNFLSVTSESVNVQRGGSYSVTSSAMPNNNDLSATSDIMSQEGGNNPALVAYREIVKMVVKELGITYPKALKIAAQVQKDVKEKNSDVTPDKLFKLATEQFKSTRSKYEKMAPK